MNSPTPSIQSVRATWGGQALTCHAGGLRWETAGRVRDESWDSVLAIATLDVTAKLYGFQIARWMHLSIELRDHTWIKMVSRDAEAIECAAIARRHAMPFITQRLAGELQAGREVSFGKVTLSRTTLRVGSKSWPLDQIAGFRAYQGTWMLDVGPRETPSLKARVRLDQFANYDAFCVLIEQLRPGLDYGPDPVDRGTVFRPSASSHDPRYVSGRTRLLIFGGMAAVPLLAGLVYFVMDASDSADYMARHQKGKQAAAKLFAELKGTAARETAPFACTGPLTEGSDNGQLVGAIGAAPGFTGLSDRLPIVLESGATGLLLSDSIEVDKARYVIRGELVSMTAPTSGAAGTARIALHVTEQPSGTVVCRGVYEPVLKPETGSTDSRYADIHLSHLIKDAAVHPVCAAGGPALCKSVEWRIGPPAPPLPAPAEPPPPKKKAKSRRT